MSDTITPKQQALETLRGALPPIVPWCHVSKHLGGLVSKQTLFNAASAGDAPESFLIGRRRCSTSDVLITWLEQR